MRVTALAGGVGAARLLRGVVSVLPPADLTVVVNTGDDFEWMGLKVCPDLDTIIYTLAGISNPATGWGVRDDAFRCLERISELGGPSWFRIGDRDLATHLLRTELLAAGESLSAATKLVAGRNGVTSLILPMSDQPVPTLIDSDEGTLSFQHYFVRRQCEPVVRGISFAKAEEASPAPGVLEAIRAAGLVLLCPSNPLISIGPILAIPGVRDALRRTGATVAAVSPLIGGRAVKGPAAKMLEQLGHEVSAAGVAALYGDFLNRFFLDPADSHLAQRIAATGIEVHSAPLLMNSQAASTALARAILDRSE